MQLKMVRTTDRMLRSKLMFCYHFGRIDASGGRIYEVLAYDEVPPVSDYSTAGRFQGIFFYFAQFIFVQLV